jgi:uncharacterized protein DUF4199
MEEQNTIENLFDRRNHLLKWGIIIGIIGILISALTYGINEKLMAKWWLGIISFIISFGLLIYAEIIERKAIGGYILFKRVFFSAFIIFIISGIITIIWQILLFNVIDPDLQVRLKRVIIEQTISMLEKFGTDSSKVAETMDKLESQDMYSIANQLKNGFLGIAIGGLIFSAIIGLIVKRKKPELDY